MGGGYKLFNKVDALQLCKELDQEWPNLTHSIVPETFHEWCCRKTIKGNFREALYHALMAKKPLPDDPDELESLWESTWLEILDQAMKQALKG